MGIWIIELDGGSLLQSADQPGTMGTPEGVRSAEVPRVLDLARECWDWENEAIASCHTPAEAAAKMWERAKAYRDGERYFATVPVADVVPGEIVMVECKGNSRDKVTNLALGATWAKQLGAPYSVTFKDGTLPENRLFTVDADQTIAIKAALTVSDGLCHAASQGVLAAIEAALLAGATAEQIFAIDITAGYPAGPISPPVPPQEES